MPKKRTAMNKLLWNESFRFDIYREQQAGFTTERPEIWLRALYAYSNNESVISRWETKNNKKKRICECTVRLCFNVDQNVIITTKLSTGVLIVRGSAYKSWIEKEFNLVEILVDSIDPQYTKVECKKKQSTQIRTIMRKREKRKRYTKLKNYGKKT